MAFEIIEGPGGVTTPYGVVPFDEHGNCTGPAARDEAVARAAEATDVFLFSHGWNNDWAAATGRYREFIARYGEARQTGWPAPDRPYRPLAIGVFWPSTALVAPWERAPDIAASVARDAQRSDELLALGAALAPADAGRLYELLDRGRLTAAEAAEVAHLLAPALDGPADELRAAGTSAEDAEELVKAWGRMDNPAASSEAGEDIPDDDEPEPGAAPAVAGGLGWLDPRGIIRAATVLLMKDRAGRVGAAGVAPLLEALCRAPGNPRVHLIGHSYGAKVLLSALCTAPADTPPVDSVLLLQPAVSAWCFAGAGHVPGSDGPGGYHAAPERSREPIVTTFSRHDVPLTRLFHWAVRRASDLGEVSIAAGPPSRYAALGGFGPQGRDDDVRVLDPVQPPQVYPLGPDQRRIIAVRADTVIGGHGAVTNPATAWMLLSQVRAGPAAAPQNTVLRIRLDRTGPGPARAAFELHPTDGMVVPIGSVPVRQLGLPDVIRSARDVRESGFTLPARMRDLLAQWLVDHRRAPLWLDLSAPRGYLHLVPWERLLSAPLGRTVLRLPDFTVPSNATGESLRIVLVASEPRTTSMTLKARTVADLALHWRQLTGRRVYLHVFTDVLGHDQLRTDLGHLDGVTVAGPPPSTGWLGWIEDQLAGTAIDVLHFVGHGYLAGEHGCLALAADAVGGDEATARLIGPAELDDFMCRTGAWSLCVSAMPWNASIAGLRELADATARIRPGVTMLHDLMYDDDLKQFGAAVGLFFGGTAPAQPLPAVAGWTEPGASGPRATFSPYESATTLFDAGEYLSDTRQVLALDRTPTWVATGTRILEGAQVDWSGPSGAPDDPDAIAALRDVTELFNAHVRRQTGGTS
ncbi:hypothetical protein ACQP00_32015 [Dactylosporangium sp. CS-047395]|uniref:hypothetical protein n=1 Tax=Dactylosporangium sp. CS-047395 TaxID=3239936 RepID=UPI003D8B5A44